MKYLNRVLALSLFGLLSGSVYADNSYGLPAEIKDGNILHCFDWKMSDIQKELPNIAEAGFVAVQISPVQRNVGSVIWYDVYRPFDYKFISSTLGSADDLKNLCKEAEKFGIKIIVDVVFNHVDNKGYHDSWWDVGDRLRSTNSYINYGNRKSITTDKMGDYPEINTENPDVIARAKAYVEELKSYGVSGIRFDAAKHIGLPSEGSEFWEVITSVPGMFYYGEILGNPGGSNSTALMKEYTDYLYVTDESYSTSARSSLGVPTSQGNWSQKGIDASRLVFWGESHDTYANTEDYGGVTKNTPQTTIDRAYAILSCRNNGIGLYFSRPSSNQTGNIKVGQKGSTHFKDAPVAEINKFKNEMVGKADSYSYNSTASSVTRKDGGAVIVSKSAYATVSVPNGNGYCPVGEYYDRVSGQKFIVTETTIEGKTGGSGIAVIYGDFVPDDDFVIDDGESDSPQDGVYVYCTNPQNWENVYVYMYTSGGASITNGGWPGQLMTLTEDKLWEYKVPEELWYNTLVMFNDGKNTSQYPGKVDSQSEDGYLLNGKTMISEGTGNSDWKEFDRSTLGVDEIENDVLEGEIRWYTLQGLQIRQPSQPGIYIRYTPNGKTEKILFK